MFACFVQWLRLLETSRHPGIIPCSCFIGGRDHPSPLPAFRALLGATPAPLLKRLPKGLSVATAPLRHSQCEAEAVPGGRCYFSPPKRRARHLGAGRAEHRGGCGWHRSSPGRAGLPRTGTPGWGWFMGVLPAPPLPASPPPHPNSLQPNAKGASPSSPPSAGQKWPVPLAGRLGKRGPRLGGDLCVCPPAPTWGTTRSRRG